MKKGIASALAVLAIVLGGCGGSSDEPPPEKSWRSTGFQSDSVLYLSSSATLGTSAFVGGILTDYGNQVWTYARGVWSGQSTGPGYAGLVSALAPADSKSVYVGWYTGTTGYVYQYTPTTSAMVDLVLPKAAVVRSLVSSGDTLYVGGGERFSVDWSPVQAWTYQAGQWATLDVPVPRFRPSDNCPEMLTLTSLAVNGDEVFVAGDTSDLDQHKPYNATVIARRDGAWTGTSFPEAVEVYALASDGKGNVYAGGIDSNFRGQVWRFANGQWQPTGPAGANAVNALAVDANGVVYAGGKDILNNYRGQVWRLEAGGWQSLGFTDGHDIIGLAIGQNNVVYATGIDLQGDLQVWLYE